MGWLALLTGIVGLAGMILAYKFNPTIQARAKLDKILKEINEWEDFRDKALSNNDNDALTLSAARLKQLRQTQASLFQQLGIKNSGG